MLGELTNFCFNGGDKKFIAITRSCAIWPNSQEKHKLLFDKSSLKLATNDLLQNSYFNLGCTYFCELIGIPMGSDLSHFMVNLFLYCYDRKYLLQTKKRNMRKVRIFSNIFRFINDLCKFSNNEFERAEGKWGSLKSLVFGPSKRSPWQIWQDLQLSCLIKEIPFSFLLITCPI